MRSFEQPKFVENSLEEDAFCTIMSLLEEKKINEAENMLMELLDRVHSARDNNILYAALFFYQTLNEWEEKELEQVNYSREEIRDGIQFVMEIYHCRAALIDDINN